MNYAAAMEKIAGYRQETAKLRQEMRKIQAAIEPEAVADYVFATAGGPAKLSELFGGKDTLYIVHNMGVSCPYCTMWADGLNGLYGYMTFRAALVVVSPDAPTEQAATAARLALSHGQPRRHQLRQGHGLWPGRAALAGGLGVPAARRQDPARFRCGVRPGRRFLPGLAPAGPAAGGGGGIRGASVKGK